MESIPSKRYLEKEKSITKTNTCSKIYKKQRVYFRCWKIL